MTESVPTPSDAVPAIPVKRPLWPSVAMIVGGVGVFIAIALDLVYHGRIDRWNEPVAVYLHQHATPWGTFFFSGLSGLGEFAVLFPYAVLVGAVLFYRRQFRATVLWGGSLIGCVAINEILKHLFKVPRPTEFTFYAFGPHPGYSFPSGHTMGVAITAGGTVLFASRFGLLSRRETRLAIAAAIALSISVAFALMYIGVHTLIDVLAGLAVSLAWVGVIGFFLARGERAGAIRRSPRESRPSPR